MTPEGPATICIWHDVDALWHSEFLEWHNKEHIPERTGIPGFLRGRRYVGQAASPEYFVLYEADGLDTLTGGKYRELAANPTPASREAGNHTHSPLRYVCNSAYSRGYGAGGAVLTCRVREEKTGSFGPDYERLLGGALDQALALPGTVAIHLCIPDRAATVLGMPEAAARSLDLPVAVLLMEASTETDARLAFRTTIGDSNRPDLRLDTGLYRLEIVRTSRDP